VSAMGSRLVHLHANDYDDNSDCLLPGQGKSDFAEIFSTLYKNGFCGESIIEVYRSNYGNYNELVSSMHFLERLERKK